MNILVKNGTCILPDDQRVADIYIENGKIAEIADSIEKEGVDVIDATGLHIFPGIIDTQVHFREPGPTHKEDLETGSKAAVLGGVTTFMEMPNTNPATTTADAITDKVNRGIQKSYANFGFFMGATGNNLDELKKVHDLEGCCGIKIFLGSSTGTLLLYDEEKLLEILNECPGMIAVHSENEEMLNARIHIRDNAKTAHEHPVWRDAETALSSTKMIIDLAKKAKRKVHVLHITTKEEMKFLGENKEHCSVEATPQHLTLSAPECYDKLGTYAQMNPPIRTIDHQEGLWKGIEDATVDVIGSDHAPHTKEEKDQGYPKSPSGMPGVQTIFPLMLDHHLNGKLELDRLVNLLCERPAELYNLNKGHIVTGFDGDLTIVDMLGEHVITNEEQASKCKWTPFAGKSLKGKVIGTIVGGNTQVWQGKIVGTPCAKPITRRENKDG